MVSKTKMLKRARRKKNSEVVETINLAKKNPEWKTVLRNLSSSTRKYSSVNLKDIEKNTSEGDTIVVVGKILGIGEVSKRVRICALGFSESAKNKLKSTKSEVVNIMTEIKKNPKAEGIKLIK